MIRVYIGIAICLALAGGGWWLHHSGYESGRADCQASHQATQAKAQREHRQQMVVADSIQTRITHTGDLKVADSIEASHATIQTIIRTVAAHPSAARCVAPADSVQRLQAVVRQANAAASRLRRPSAGDTDGANP